MPRPDVGHRLPSAIRFRLSPLTSADLRRFVIVFLGWLKGHRYEILAVVIITAVGGFLRLYRLDGIPAGFHGDEALNGLRAHAILDRRWAGPYDPSHGYGQPAGFEFWTAGLIWLFGDGIVVVRMAMAVLAVATLPVAYLLFRAIDGRATAVIGTSLFAVSSWHLVWSRVAISSGMPVFTEVLAALILVLALRSRKWWLFPMAGVALALGVYTNNSHPVFLVGVAVFLLWWLFTQRARFRSALLGAAALTVALFLASLPILSYIKDHQDSYFKYPRSQSIFSSSRYEEASGLLAHADVVLDSGRDYVQLVVFEGAPAIPMLAPATSVLLGLGLLYAARRWREPGIVLAVILVLVIPWAGILTPVGNSYLMRRTMGVIPFISLLAALPLSAALRSKYLARPYLRALAVTAALAAIVSVGLMNASFYFDDYAGYSGTKEGLNYSLVQASEYMDDLSGDPYVYFYSKRWSFDYSVRQYLAPDVEGEDRSGNWGSSFDIVPDRSRDVVYVFMDSFLDASDYVQSSYPGGYAFDSVDSDGTVLFRAYHLPAPSPPGGQ